MKNTKKNTIIRASAGSGKTWQLSNRFLDRLLRAKSVEIGLDSMLASTFTSKAAGEISDRIFTKFAEIALDFEKREELREHIDYPEPENGAQTEEEELQKRLIALVKAMYRMRTGTMDSYFQRVASAFSLELGLPAKWASVGDSKDLEYKRLLTEAVQELLDDPATAKEARGYIDTLLDDKAKRKALDNLVELAVEMLPLVREVPDDAWVITPDDIQKAFGVPVLDDKAAAASCRKTLEPFDVNKLPRKKGTKTKLGDVRSDFLKAYLNMVAAIDAGDWENFLNLTFVVKMFSAKSKKENDKARIFYGIDLTTLPDEHFKIVRILVAYAVSFQIEPLARKTLATRDLLKRIAEKLDAVMDRERIFTFRDVTRKVGEYGLDEDRIKSLHHRLDGELAHLMLDEFQDTSPHQWGIFQPLVQRVAKDPDGSFFCVGDVKQAIYGWRGGVAEIFNTMGASLRNAGIDVHETTLELTRRCRPPIVDTLNRVYLNLHGNAAIKEISEDLGKRWQEQRRFEKHASHYTDAGYCTLEQSPETESVEESHDAVHLKYVCDRVEELAKTIENRPDLKAGIGVIVKKGKLGTAIVTELKKRGIEVNGGGGSLKSSAAVRYVLSALTLADHPGNAIALFHLMTGPLKTILKIPDDSTWTRLGDKYCSLRIRKSLSENGYGRTIQDYVNVLLATRECDASEQRKLEKLLELAYLYDEEPHGIRTKLFVEKVKGANVSNPGAANITVTTLHSAKGLEYDIVVLPELHDEISSIAHKGKRRYVIGYETQGDKTSPVEFVLRYVNQNLHDMLPEKYRDSFVRYGEDKTEESLSELYVAMTRPIYQLVMINKSRNDRAQGTSYGDVLLAVLPKNGPEDFSNIYYSHGDAKWYEHFPVVDEKKSKTADAPLVCTVSEETECRHVGRITPSTRTGEGGHKSGTVAKAAATAATVSRHGESLEWGTAIHACFERGVEWLDSSGAPVDDSAAAPVSDEELEAIVRESLQDKVYHFKPCQVVAEFRTACSNPVIVEALSQKRYAPYVPAVQRERRIVVWRNKKILRGIIDRLVVQRDDAGTIRGIEVLDFKSNVALDVDAYREQMREYRKGVATLFQVDETIVKTTLVFVLLGQVVPVE